MVQAPEKRSRPRFNTPTGPRKMVVLRFPVTFIEEFQALARRNDRSMTAEVERAMRAHLAHNQE